MNFSKYHNWYDSLINYARSESRTKKDGYFENHHVLPRSLGGPDSKDNKVLLTAREHFVAHLLLTKMYEGTDRSKMVWALHRLTFSRTGKRNYSSHEYELARKIHGKNMAKPKSEETKAKMRKPKSPEHAAKLKAAVKEMWKTRDGTIANQKMREVQSKLPHPLLGKHHTTETKSKIAASLVGRKASEETKANFRMNRTGNGNSMYGKNHSDETRTKMKEAWARRKEQKLIDRGNE